MKRPRSTILTLALTFAVCAFSGAAFAATDSDPNLAKLEVKFFQHDYAKDDLDTRLDRLEKLVFGEAKTGDGDTRLKNLVSSVASLDPPSDNATASGDAAPGAGGSAADDVAQDSTPAPRTSRPGPDAQTAEREKQITDGSQYPAVTAMEKKILGKDFASEPIVKRLDRLETKVFGKAVASNDLSDRVDRLKSQTGIDLARTPPPGSDWADDDDMGGNSELTYVPEKRPALPSYDPSDDPMFNNRGGSVPSRPSYGSAWSGGGSDMTAGSGTYGGNAPAPSRSAGGYTPGGGYGYTAPRKVASALPPTASGIPRTAPDVVRTAGDAPPTAMGLSAKLGLLENELFRKNFINDTIPVRLNRLESTVFPGSRPPGDMSLPDRVNRLMAAVPVSQPGAPRVAQTAPKTAPDYDDSGMPPMAPQRQGGGLSRIINGLGNLLMGGNMGAYPVNSNLVQDPTTGMLIDRMTGNVIDPTTGVVVRPGMGAPVAGYGGAYNNGFNNGLSPIGSPYGMSNSMRFGFGGSGIRFGGGSMGMGMGGMGMGGMGVGGMPMGVGGMGVWP
jgi:hypothetical protein